MISLISLIILLQINLIENTSKRSTGLDCTRRNANGLYGRGCSSKFLRCHDGKLYVYRCSKNRKFNVETAKCEEPEQVIACINNMDNDRTIVKAVDPFDCSKRNDGVYGTGKCSTTYYHCSRGHSAEMLCPAGLYYNDKLKGCDEVDSIDECNVLTALQGYNERREGHLGERGKYIERNLMSIRDGQFPDINERYIDGARKLSLGREKMSKDNSSNDKKRPARQTLNQTSIWKSKRELNCTQMRNGNYPMINGQCSKYFWHCSNGRSIGRICHDELFFNKATQKCDTLNNIEDCINNKQLIENNAVELNCIQWNENIMEHSACSDLYYNCTAGKLLELQCPQGQVYDAKQKQCDAIEFVPECINSENPSQTTTNDPIQISKIVPAPELNEFCNASGDGLYSVGCENYFYFCASNNGYHVKCPEGLFFDSETRICNYKKYVHSCNLDHDDSNITPSKQIYDYNIITTTRSMYQIDKSTKKIEIDETQTKEVSKTKNMPEASLPASISTPISQTKILPILSRDFDCRSKADGFYSIGCKTEFVACANHRIFFFECPYNLIFNEEAQTCDYAKNIKDCSKMINNEEKETTCTEIERESSSEKKEIKGIDGTIIRDNAFCKKLKDGVYFNDCGNEYIVCSRHVTFVYNCPEGQIVNPTSKICDKAENIPECVNANDRI
ncbi:Chitin binding Peritrophin-A domain family protein [Brugia pahangi]